MDSDFTKEDWDELLKCLGYRQLAVESRQETPASVRRENLDRIDALRAKILAAKEGNYTGHG